MKQDSGHTQPHIGALTINDAGIITSFQATLSASFGYTPEEIIGQPIKLLIQECCSPTGVTGILTESDYFRFNDFTGNRASARRKNGECFPIWLALSKLNMGAEQISLCTILEASESNNEEKSQARLHALIESSSDAIMSKTLDGIVTSWNPAAEQMFGYSEAEMLGQPMTRLMPEDKLGEEVQILRKLRAGEKVEHFETIRRKKNGELFPVSVTISPIRDAHGHIFGASKIARDISYRKSVENELRQHRDHLEELVANKAAEMSAIVQTAVNGIISINAKGIIQVFNPAAEKLFGWERNEILGKNISLLMEHSHAEKHNDYLSQFMRTGLSKVIGIERKVIAKRKNGETFPAHLAIGHAALSESQHFFVGFITDISEQEKIEENLKRAKDEAESGARAKAAFVANMSHEIRTPMNAIIGFAEVILQDPLLSARSQEHIHIILSSAKSLLGIINDILDVSKLESGKFALETVAFHLPNALADALKLIDHQATEKGLNVTLAYHNDLPIRVVGDPTRLRQVVLNLVSNAIKFTEQGHIQISVQPWPQENMLHFSVSDTGIGMTPEQMNNIFESFSQADSSTTRRFGGTGLGTAISKQITELMHGKIWVESAMGQGSVFHFTAHLPAIQADDFCLYEEYNSITNDYKSPRKFRVLLVEDIEANASLANLRLNAQGHQVDWSENGLQAIEAFRSKQYDLILMDVMMPEMDGLEATRQIRRLEAEISSTHTQSGQTRIPIIALTASIMREDYERCMAAGMDRVQAKPVDFDELLYTMEQIVPAGIGEENALQKIDIVAPSYIDFSPVEACIHYQAALKVWRAPDIYLKALLSFANERANDAEQIERLLFSNPDDAEPARAIAHALKGLAGNLFIYRVADLATKIDAELKSKHRKTAIAELGQLRWRLSEASQAIQTIHTNHLGTHDGSSMHQKLFDAAAVAALLERLSIALQELNPESAEPILADLSEYLPKNELSSIQKAVDAFDFDDAQIQTIALVEKLGI